MGWLLALKSALALIARYWRPLLGLALLALAYHWGATNERTEADAEMAQLRREQAEVIAATQAKARAAERRHVDDMAAIAQTYEKERADAQRQSQAVADGLRAGSISLRDHWRGCETGRVSAIGAAVAERDAAAADREASAGRIVQAAAEADAQIRALQDIVRADRQ